jgi:uncharacterized protein (DUF1778 family)
MEKETLSERVSFRLNKKDYAFYKNKVANSGLSPSEFFRTAVLTNQTQIISKKHTPEKKQMIYLLSKTSNNINQLAHRINADHKIGQLNEQTYVALLNALDNISSYLKAMVKHAD